MNKLLAATICAFGFVFPDSSGAPVTRTQTTDPQAAAWIAAAKVPTPPFIVEVKHEQCPGLSSAQAIGCVTWDNPQIIWISPHEPGQRGTFYHELWHSLDIRGYITDAWRQQFIVTILNRFPNAPHGSRGWLDGLDPPLEQSAEVYRLCALYGLREPQNYDLTNSVPFIDEWPRGLYSKACRMIRKLHLTEIPSSSSIQV